MLQVLLQVSANLDKEEVAHAATETVCEAAVSAFGRDVSAAMLLVRSADGISVNGSCGLKEGNGASTAMNYEDPFAALVMAENRTASIEDLEKTPDIPVPAPPAADAFRAVLASPLVVQGKVLAVLQVLSTEPRQWSEVDYRVIQWLAAQGSLILQAVRLQEELDRRAQEAEAASIRKTRFLAAVSHDVRTPANAISLMADMVKLAGESSEMAAKVPKLCGDLQTNSRMLVELVSDVLDLSRFDSGKVDLEETDFCLSDAMRAEVAQYEPLADAGGLALVTAMSGEPIWIRSDRMKLARILGNLVGNAIKFTEVGSVHVSCERSADGCVEVKVEDTGVGISKEHLEHIFDEFYQIKNPERDRNKGTGLGLAICKRLIDALGFSIIVQSEQGAGTTFRIRIPKEIVQHHLSRPRPKPSLEECSSVHPLAGVRVLVVEDHEMTRQAVSALLKGNGAIVEQAADGRAGMRALAHDPPDVVLLDLMLPDMDGREVLRHLLEDRPQRLSCVLAVSGDVTDTRQKEIKRLGADGLLPKPIKIEELVQRIASHVRSEERELRQTFGCAASSN